MTRPSGYMPASVASSYFRRVSSSVPNEAGMSNFGMIGSESSSYSSTLSATSRVLLTSSGFSAKSRRMSASDLNHSSPV